MKIKITIKIKLRIKIEVFCIGKPGIITSPIILGSQTLALRATATHATFDAPCGLEIKITRYAGNLEAKGTAGTPLSWNLSLCLHACY